MNTWQLCKQLKDLLQAREWEGDSGNIVFASSSVFSTAGPIDEDALGNRRTPFAMIYVLGSQVDPTMNELPGLIRQEIGVRLAVSVPGDAVGENPLMGANPTGTNPYTSSKGRGLLEVQEELLATIEYLGNSNGINIQSRASSAVASSVQQDNEYVCARDYTFEALVTSSRSYPPARSFASAESGGTVTLTWKNPAERFDFYQVIVRRGATSGAAAPTAIDGGTAIYNGTAATDTDIPGAGTWNYSIFATYDDISSAPALDRKVSEKATTSIVVS